MAFPGRPIAQLLGANGGSSSFPTIENCRHYQAREGGRGGFLGVSENSIVHDGIHPGGK